MEDLDYTPGKVLSQSEGFALIANYLSSGQSSGSFYKQIGMSEKTFYKWRRRYMSAQLGQNSDVPDASNNGALVPVRIARSTAGEPTAPSPSSGYAYEVEFSSGIRVRMQSASHAERLLYICNELK